jgi:hypothetical protein
MDWKEVAAALQKQEMPACIGDDGKRYVRLPDHYQRLLCLLEEGVSGEISPANRAAKLNGVRAKIRKLCERPAAQTSPHVEYMGRFRETLTNDDPTVVYFCIPTLLE